MKKLNYIKLSYLFIAIGLFIVYHSWFAHQSFTAKDQILFSTSKSSCNYTNGYHPATIDYYNPQTKAEKTFHASVEIGNCEIIKINIDKKDHGPETITLPVQFESDGQATAEDNDDGIYTIRID
jgi:hypothetical protein